MSHARHLAKDFLVAATIVHFPDSILGVSLTNSLSQTRRSSSAISGVAGGFFADAGKVGAVNGTAACAQTFSSCPFDRKDIYQAFREIQNAA